MDKFDNLIMDGMVNTESMLKARLKVLQQRRKAGFDVGDEVGRAGRFLERYQAFVRDWMYWYYDEKDGHGDKGPKADKQKRKADRSTVDVRIINRMNAGVLPQASDIELVLDRR